MNKDDFIAWRHRLELTQVGAARLLNVTDRQVRYLEAGHCPISKRIEQACIDVALRRQLYGHNRDNDDTETPAWFFRQLNREFRFTLDAAATAKTAKVKRFISPEQDALSQAWTGRVFCNPPYSRRGGGLAPWINHGFRQLRNGAELVVFLIPVRTSNDWWHNIVMAHAAEIRFIRGSLFGTS